MCRRTHRRQGFRPYRKGERRGAEFSAQILGRSLRRNRSAFHSSDRSRMKSFVLPVEGRPNLLPERPPLQMVNLLTEGPIEGTSSGRHLRVLLVSNASLVRVALKQLLSSAAGIKVVGESGIGTDSTEAAARVNPDIIVLDYQHKNGDVTGQLRGFHTVCPNARMILLSEDESGEGMFSAARERVWGYLPRDITAEELIRAVKTVSRGWAVIGCAVTPDDFSRLGSLSRRDGGSEPRLSLRESSVLRAMAAGHTDNDVARQLGVSVPTVKTHVRSILKKTGSRNRAAAIATGFRHGLLP